MRKFTLPIMITALTLCLFPSAHAQKTAKPPIEITADQSLEWDRGNQVFYARGQARATQGDTRIDADTLTAQYRDGANEQGLDIWQFSADDNVTLTAGDTKAFGDNALYNLDNATATLTGANLRITSPGQSIIARDKIEYLIGKNQIIATGAVKITQRSANGQTNTLNANKVVATLAQTNGKRTLQKVEAYDNVVITTPSEILRGGYAIYNAVAGTAELKHNVTIKRGPNTLEGERASVNLNTNVSTLYGGAQKTTGENGRVRAVFYPSSQ